MAWQRLGSRSQAERATVVEAPTLKEALRLVRQKYGDDVHVIRSRTVSRRQPGSLGQKKSVEVLIQREAGRAVGGMLDWPAGPDTGGGGRLAGEIAAEVARIEELVRRIAVKQAGTGGMHRCRDNPVAEALVRAGADPGVVVRLSDRCQAETGAEPRDQQALLAYLRRSLATGSGTWQDMAGLHVFLGPAGGGRSGMVLSLAAKLSELGQQVLVLSLLPRHAGEIRRLQAAAAAADFDAAVIQKARQLGAASTHLGAYSVVLLDAPAFKGGDGQEIEELQRRVIQHPSYHRHLVFPLDRDLMDSQDIVAQAKQWHCDWLALTRLDQTPRRGKLLNLLDLLPLPVSMVHATAEAAEAPIMASPDLLVEIMMDGPGKASTGGQ